MRIEDAFEYIIPIVKMFKINVGGVMVINDKLYVTNWERSILHICNIQNLNLVWAGTIQDTIDSNPMFSQEVYSFMQNMVVQYSPFESTVPLYKHEHLEIDSEFEPMMKMKAASPRMKWVEDNIYIPMFYGIIRANKGDTIDFEKMYENEYDTLIRFSVFHKKLKILSRSYIKLLTIHA